MKKKGSKIEKNNNNDNKNSDKREKINGNENENEKKRIKKLNEIKLVERGKILEDDEDRNKKEIQINNQTKKQENQKVNENIDGLIEARKMKIQNSFQESYKNFLKKNRDFLIDIVAKIPKDPNNQTLKNLKNLTIKKVMKHRKINPLLTPFNNYPDQYFIYLIKKYKDDLKIQNFRDFVISEFDQNFSGFHDYFYNIIK